MTPCFIRSSRRPGVATTMSTPRRSCCTWPCWLTPPKIVMTLRPATVASGSMTSRIWLASSRVGARIRPRGWPGWVRPAGPDGTRRARRATSGSAKARVLPEPVRPRPSTSLPARVSGRVAVWMANGAVMPRLVSGLTRAAGTPSSTKVAGTELGCDKGKTAFSRLVHHGPGPFASLVAEPPARCEMWCDAGLRLPRPVTKYRTVPPTARLAAAQARWRSWPRT